MLVSSDACVILTISPSPKINESKSYTGGKNHTLRIKSGLQVLYTKFVPSSTGIQYNIDSLSLANKDCLLCNAFDRKKVKLLNPFWTLITDLDTKHAYVVLTCVSLAKEHRLFKIIKTIIRSYIEN